MAKLVKTKGAIQKDRRFERLKLYDQIEIYEIGSKVICNITGVNETIFYINKQCRDIENYIVQHGIDPIFRYRVHWKNIWPYEDEIINIIGYLM